MDIDALHATLDRVAANVRRLRLERRFTQAELAERASVDLRYLQRIEAAGVNAGCGYIAALAAALDVDPGALFATAKPAVRKRGRPPSPRR